MTGSRPARTPSIRAPGEIFSGPQIDIPKPVVPVHVAAPVVVPQGPPPPPPINLKFFGFANKPGEPKKIFLSQGEDVFIAGEGDIVDRRYKILHITPVSVEVEDVLNNNRQSIPLTQGTKTVVGRWPLVVSPRDETEAGAAPVYLYRLASYKMQLMR